MFDWRNPTYPNLVDKYKYLGSGVSPKLNKLGFFLVKKKEKEPKKRRFGGKIFKIKINKKPTYLPQCAIKHLFVRPFHQTTLGSNDWLIGTSYKWLVISGSVEWRRIKRLIGWGLLIPDDQGKLVAYCEFGLISLNHSIFFSQLTYIANCLT